MSKAYECIEKFDKEGRIRERHRSIAGLFSDVQIGSDVFRTAFCFAEVFLACIGMLDSNWPKHHPGTMKT